MKTSELKKIIEDNKLKIYKEKTDDLILDDAGAVIARFDTKRFGEFKICYECPRVVAQAILHYAYTPIEEREEEKKYRLFLPDAFSKTVHNCLNLKKEYGTYIFDTITEIEIYQTSFTQKEIDDMPFDTNFFIKEEVK